jgi:hypothetical protein
MNIQPVVEGHGDIAAIPVLLRRLIAEAGCFGIEVNTPIRKPRSSLVKQGDLEKSIRLAKLQANTGAVLLIIDGDDDCPKELGPKLQQWAESVAMPLPIRVVIAHREYEAWFLASLQSLRGRRGIRDDVSDHPDPESPRDAKGHLEQSMNPGHSYLETADQAALTGVFDMEATFRKCRSFRKMTAAFGQLASSILSFGVEWPPVGWITPVQGNHPTSSDPTP